MTTYSNPLAELWHMADHLSDRERRFNKLTVAALVWHPGGWVVLAIVYMINQKTNRYNQENS